MSRRRRSRLLEQARRDQATRLELERLKPTPPRPDPAWASDDDDVVSERLHELAEATRDFPYDDETGRKRW